MSRKGHHQAACSHCKRIRVIEARSLCGSCYRILAGQGRLPTIWHAPNGQRRSRPAPKHIGQAPAFVRQDGAMTGAELERHFAEADRREFLMPWERAESSESP